MIPETLRNLLLAVGVGVGTGYYVFQPLLKEYEAETNGTWMRPGDEERIKARHAAVHPKSTEPVTNEPPAKS